MDRTLKQILFGIVLFSCAFVCQCVPQRSTTGQDVNPSRSCHTCPPSWITTLENFKSMITTSMMETICPMAKKEGFIGHCDTPNTTCSTSSNKTRAKFCCCPASMLSIVAQCLPGKTNICIPDTFGPWQNQIQKAMLGGLLG